MPQTFASGLSRAQRTLILNGAVQLLSGLLKHNGGYLGAVTSWGGIIRSYTDTDGISMLHQALKGRAPAIAIALGARGFKPAGMGGFQWQGPIDLLVYHYTQHRGGLDVGRQQSDARALVDATAEPGLHVQMEHAFELLIGQRCGASSTIKQIVPEREDELWTDEDMTLWLQHYSVHVTNTISEFRNVTQLLTEIRTTVHTSDDTSQVPGSDVVIDNTFPNQGPIGNFIVVSS